MYFSHRGFALECIFEFVVHGVVEGSTEGTLVLGDVGGVPIENLTNGIDSSRG